MTAEQRRQHKMAEQNALQAVVAAAERALWTIPIDRGFPSWLDLRVALEQLRRIEKEGKEIPNGSTARHPRVRHEAH